MGMIFQINGVDIPTPAPGYRITRSQNVDAGRNTKGAVVGQLVGRKIYKLDNLKWNGLDADTWKKIQDALEPFFVKVTFVDDTNEVKNITCYPSDTTATPLFLDSTGKFTKYETCGFNLIDCGWDE